MNIMTWFAHNKVAANILMGLIMAFGLIAMPQLQTEVVPSVQLDWLIVDLPFKGFTADAIEESGVVELEQRILSIKGVEEVTTQISHGTINMQIIMSPASSADQWKIKADIRSMLEGIERPPDSGNPSVQQINIEPAVALLAVSGDFNHRDLKVIGRQVKEDLESLPAIGSVDFFQPNSAETQIVLDPVLLQQYSISAIEISQTLKRYYQQLNVGVIGGQAGDIPIITRDHQLADQLPQGIDLESLVLRVYPSGGELKLGDVAHIAASAKNTAHRMDDQAAVILSVHNNNHAGLLDVDAALQGYLAKAQHSLPQGVELKIWQNMAKYYKSRSLLLQENGVIGLAILLVILTLSLKFRVGFWVSLGIPVAFLGALGVLWLSGNSLNMVSQFAFLLVLGILVDDAIIVGESIHSLQAKGYSPTAAAVFGTRQVAKPVIIAVLTTIIMFAPLLFLPGDEGRMLRSIPVVVIAALMFSLIESLLILPAHLASKASNNKITQRPASTSSWIQPITVKILRNPWSVISLAGALLLVVIGLAISGRVDYVFFAKIESDVASAHLTMVPGSSTKDFNHAMDTLESTALALQADPQQYAVPSIAHVLRFRSSSKPQAKAQGSVAVEMSTSAQREVSAEAVGKVWKSLLPSMPGVARIDMQTTLNNTPDIFEFRLQSNNRQALNDAYNGLKRQLLTQNTDLTMTAEAFDEPHVLVTLNRFGIAQGVSSQELAGQIRLAFEPSEMFTINSPEGKTAVTLALPENLRSSISALERMLVQVGTQNSATPQVMPLKSLANIQMTNQAAQLNRRQGRPSMLVQMDGIDLAQSDQQLAEIEQLLKQQWPAVSLDLTQFQTEKVIIERYLLISFAFALILMYGLMAALQSSYIKPLVILCAVPFGAVGAFIGHFVLAIPITLYSLIGAFAVAGVVVNDNLVLVDRYQELLKREGDKYRAIVGAVVSRSRPVILTTVTTVVGLLPLIIETSVQSQFLKPMALSLAAGITLASLVTLLLVPSILLVLPEPKITQLNSRAQLFSSQSSIINQKEKIY